MPASFRMQSDIYFIDNSTMAPPPRPVTPSRDQFVTVETNLLHSKSFTRSTKDMWPLAFYGNEADQQLQQCPQRNCNSTNNSRSPINDSQTFFIASHTPRKRYRRARRHDSVVQPPQTQSRPVDEFESWYADQTTPSTASSEIDVATVTAIPQSPMAHEAKGSPSSPKSSSPRWYRPLPRSTSSTFGRSQTPNGSPPKLLNSVANDSFPIVTPTKPQLNPYIFDNNHLARTRNRSSSALRSPSPFSTSFSSGGNEPPQFSLDLPLPDFIAPRPAVRQRYVPAGGTAKLKDRPEIPNFQLPPTVVHNIAQVPQQQETFVLTQSSTTTTSNDNFLTMSPEDHSMDLDPPACISAWDSSPVSKQRGSSESDKMMMMMFRGEKRGRTASSASMRERIKRVFSRKASEVFEPNVASSQGSYQGLNGVFS